MKLLLSIFLLFTVVSAEEVVINTNNGALRGYTADSTRDGTKYAAFLGIPYAKPPVNELRFKAPQPSENWSGIRDATLFRNVCYSSGAAGNHNEDCLFLNVFTPSWNITNSSDLLAVLVYIHGGGYQAGSSDPGASAPDFYVDHGVVFVTINYRLGALGFLSLQNEDAPGNAGLKDQAQALKWVKENIRNFGGNPEKVVIFGESAGGSSVSYLQISKATEGLFSGTIHQSGECTTQWAHASPQQLLDRGYYLGNRLGCNITDQSPVGKHNMYTCLMNLTADSIQYNAWVVITEDDKRRFTRFPFIPSVEPDLPGAFFTRPPIDILRSGDFVQVPTILGAIKRDGLLFFGDLRREDPTGSWTIDIGKNMTSLIPYDIAAKINNATLETEVGRRLKEYYFQGNDITLEERQRLIDLLTDVHFIIPIQSIAYEMSKRMAQPVYSYIFSYDGPFNGFRQDPNNNGIPGPGHADELNYMMNPMYIRGLYTQYERNSPPHRVIDRMMRLWTDFAKTGSPTPVLDTLINIKWEPFTSQNHSYLDIGEELASRQNIELDTMKFWNDIYELVENDRPLPE